jgi:hypothetical protein
VDLPVHPLARHAAPDPRPLTAGGRQPEGMAPVMNQSSTSKVPLAWPRLLAAFALVVTAIAIAAYLLLVVAGKVPRDNRLGATELGLALVGLVFLVLVVRPTALDRLNLLKLPGGIELTLEKIQRQQVEQRRELDAFFSILSNLLSLPEKYHLRSLARGGNEEYVGQASLREELFRLKRFGLLDELEGQKIGDMFDSKRFKLREFLRLTSQGERFIKALDEIEA